MAGSSPAASLLRALSSLASGRRAGAVGSIAAVWIGFYIASGVGRHFGTPLLILAAGIFLVVQGLAPAGGWPKRARPTSDCRVSSRTSESELQELLDQLSEGEVTHQLLLEGLDDDSVLRVADAVEKFGYCAGLVQLRLTDSHTLQPQSLRRLVDAALGADPAPPLLELDLSGNPAVGDEVVEAIAAYLRDRGGKLALQSLHLANCSVSPAGVADLAAALTAGGLRATNVGEAAPDGDGDGDLPPPPPPPQDGTEEAEAPPAPPPPPPPPAPLAPDSEGGCRLRLVGLSGNALSGSGRALNRLARAPHLEELELARCGLLLDDVTRLSAALPRSKVRRLELARNGLTSKELMALCTNLASSRVEELGLEHNELGAGAALAALRREYARRPIPGLRLEGNRLSHKEFVEFMATLRAMPGGARLTARFSAGCAPGCECDGRGEVM